MAALRPAMHTLALALAKPELSRHQKACARTVELKRLPEQKAEREAALPAWVAERKEVARKDAERVARGEKESYAEWKQRVMQGDE